MRLNVYGRLMALEQSESGWSVYYLGADGKKRLAEDLMIPDEITEQMVVQYLADLCHEWCSPNASEIIVLD